VVTTVNPSLVFFQVAAQVMNSPDYGQALELGSAIVFLGPVERPTGVGNDFLLFPKMLRENGA